jgi:hypothetical protein
MNTDPAGQDNAPKKDLEQVGEEAVQEAVQAARHITAQDEKAGQERADRTNLDKREQIVLAKRRSGRRVVRTLAEVEDLTSVGKVLLRRLMWIQLMLSLRLMLLIVVVLVSIPLAFLLVPSLGTTNILGLRLPWLLLGLAVYPFFVAVAWFYNRSADRAEQGFAEWVEN